MVRDFPADSTWPAPERYQLELGYDARRFRLAGLQRIAFRNTGPDPLAAVWLRTWGNAFGSCARPFVRVVVRAGGRAGEERAGCTALEVRLERPVAPGERGALELAVQITAPRRPDRFGRYAGAAYFGNALPVLAVADSRGWSLPPYTFRGESFYSLSAAWDVRIALPRGVRAAMTGRSGTAPRGVVASRAGRARDFMIVAGPLRETRRRAGDVVVRHWRLRESPAGARRAAARAAVAVRTFGGWFGPYARSELDVVEGPATVARGAGIGMEYPELVLSPPSPFVLDHEVAHQWFYGIVGNDQHVAPWLDESFASYAANRLEGVAARCPPARERAAVAHRHDGRVRACAARRLRRRHLRRRAVLAAADRAGVRRRPLPRRAAADRARAPRRRADDGGLRRGAAGVGAARRERRRAAARAADRGVVPGDLFVRSWPVPAGVERRGSVVIVHGLGEHSGRYEHVGLHLAAHGYAARAYDHRGHGASPGPRGGLETSAGMLDDLAAVFAADSGETPFLLGHSLGGAVAAQAVTSGRLVPRGLILSSPALRLWLSRAQRGLLAAGLRVAPDRPVPNRLPLDKLSHDPAVVAAYRADPQVHDRITPRLTRFLLDAGAAARRDARRCTVPTLLLVSGQDQPRRRARCARVRRRAGARGGHAARLRRSLPRAVQRARARPRARARGSRGVAGGALSTPARPPPAAATATPAATAA